MASKKRGEGRREGEEEKNDSRIGSGEKKKKTMSKERAIKREIYNI